MKICQVTLEIVSNTEMCSKCYNTPNHSIFKDQASSSGPRNPPALPADTRSLSSTGGGALVAGSGEPGHYF